MFTSEGPSKIPTLESIQNKNSLVSGSTQDIITFSDAIPQLAPQQKQEELPLFSNTSSKPTTTEPSKAVPKTTLSNPFVSSHKEEERFLEALKQPTSHAVPVSNNTNIDTLASTATLPSSTKSPQETPIEPSMYLNIQRQYTTNTKNITKTPSHTVTYPTNVFWTEKHLAL